MPRRFRNLLADVVERLLKDKCKRKHRLHLRLNSIEWDTAHELAAHYRMSVSELIRTGIAAMARIRENQQNSADSEAESVGTAVDDSDSEAGLVGQDGPAPTAATGGLSETAACPV